MDFKVKKPFLVTIGTLKLYCESMTVSGETTLPVATSVMGNTVRMGKTRQPTRLSFTGRVYNADNPMALAGVADNMNGVENVEIIYKNLRYIRCVVTGYKAVDSGNEYIELTVTAETNNIAYLLDEVTE
ncbi:MAG: hypothetical protein IKJ87_03450 [Ruminococcus sp.]|nr:hypothetical protein [Ruminococcus sp.]